MNNDFDAKQANNLSMNSNENELNQILEHIEGEAKSGNNEAIWYSEINETTSKVLTEKGFKISVLRYAELEILKQIVITW